MWLPDSNPTNRPHPRKGFVFKWMCLCMVWFHGKPKGKPSAGQLAQYLASPFLCINHCKVLWISLSGSASAHRQLSRTTSRQHASATFVGGPWWPTWTQTRPVASLTAIPSGPLRAYPGRDPIAFSWGNMCRGLRGLCLGSHPSRLEVPSVAL